MTNLLIRRRSPWRLSLVATLIANKIRFHLFSFCKWMFSSNLFFLSGTPWSWVIIFYLRRWPPTPPPWLAHESKLHQLQPLVEPCKVNGHVTTRVGQMKSNIASDLADYSGGECIDECPGKMCTYQRKLSNVNTPGKLSNLNTHQEKIGPKSTRREPVGQCNKRLLVPCAN